jgi:hypothetical protein
VIEVARGRRREDTLRLASLRLAGGGGSAGLLAAGAPAARARHDRALVERLARAAIAEGAGFDARFVAAEAAHSQGRPAQAERELDGMRVTSPGLSTFPRAYYLTAPRRGTTARTGADGSRMSRDEHIAAKLESDLASEISELDCRRYGKLVVSLGRYRITGIFRIDAAQQPTLDQINRLTGQSDSTEMVFTIMWKLDDGDWRVVAIHLSLIGDATTA